MAEGNTTQLQRCLDLLLAGNEHARDALIQHSCERLMRLTRKMFRGYPRLRRWEQTDDVLQVALIRLHRSLAEVRPESVPQLLGLAATQIRRSLIDLTRHHLGPEGYAAHHESDQSTRRWPTRRERAAEPQSLEQWSRFHRACRGTAGQGAGTFDLLWYQGLSQTEAADAIGVDLRTVKRRWRSARIMVYDALDGQPPE